jgi:hypothetical protein
MRSPRQVGVRCHSGSSASSSAAGALSRARRAALAAAQDLEEGLDEIGFLEGGLLQVVPGIQRLHDAAVDGGRHGRHHQHRHVRMPLVDGVDHGHAGMALAPELDVEHHQVVALAGDGRFGVVAVEPLVDGDAGRAMRGSSRRAGCWSWADRPR